MPITALPAPPSRQDPANFAVRADAFLGALPAFGAEANELQIDVNSGQTIATAAAAAANSSAVAAANTAAAALWNSATSYLLGQNAIDTTDLRTYRRRVAGTTATRPGLDGTNWQLLTSLGDVSLAGSQIITGDKTFSGVCSFTQVVSATVTTAQVASALSDSSVLVPAGGIMYLARDTAPSGWLKANGALISRSTFAALFAAIGTRFGDGDGFTTFALPDLRGEFIRSWDDGRGVDSGRAFGSTQAGAIQSHSHVQRGVFQAGTAGGDITSGTNTGTPGDSSVATGATGTAETRPRNIALLACIKF